jgi:penicillin-binding protein 1C
MFELHQRLPVVAWIAPPLLAMKRVAVCRNDGYLANPWCERQMQWIPAGSHFDRQSPHNVLVHLDAGGDARVDSSCERVAAMRHVGWFVLPPAQEYYYRRHDAAYRPLPDLRPDCASALASRTGRAPLDFLYPGIDTKVYIPHELDGRRGRVILEAVHRDTNATLHWHIDGHYLGTTRTYHQQPLDLAAGPHVVTIVDAQGNRVERRFEVLDNSSASGPRSSTQQASATRPAPHRVESGA